MSHGRARVRCALLWLVLAASAAACATETPSTQGLRRSPGSELVRRMSFHPIQISVPRVGREVDRRVLGNGIILYLAEDHSLPVLDVSAVFRAGSLYETAARPGVAQFTASQLRNGGTADRTAEALNEELEVLGASIEASASAEAVSLSLSALVKDTDRALELLAEVIRQPAFDEKSLQIFRGRVVEDLRRLADNPGHLLAREFTRTLYTEAHPLGRPLTPAQAEAIQAKDLRDHYRRFFRPNNMLMAVVGDFHREEIAARIQALFGDWPSSPLDLPSPPEVQLRFERGVYIIPRNLAQASLTLGHFGINRLNPDRYAIELMDAILGGGGLNSRIMDRIRTEEGLAYSVGTSFPTGTRDISLFRATAQTKNENVPRAVGAILEEMQGMQRQPVSQEELDRAKEAIINSFVFRFTSCFGVVRQLMVQEFNGYPADYLDTLLDRYRAVTVADVQRVAREYLHPDASTILIIGDPTQFESAMRTFGPVHRLEVESPG
jgi:zinc protease